MANQQLVDYIKQQLGAGVGRDKIKVTLAGAGWAEADVNDAMNSAVPGVSSPIPAVSSVSPASQVASAAGQSPASPRTPQVTFGQTVKAAPVIAADIFQPKDEPVFQPKTPPDAAVKKTDVKPAAFPGSKKNMIYVIVGIVLLLALGGVAVMMYLKADSLESKVATLTNDNSSLTSQAATLTKEKNDLGNQLAVLNQEKSELEANLYFFVAPPGAAAAEPLNITVKGTLSGGDKAPYALLTTKGVSVLIKNSKDPKVDAVLKPLVGNTAEFTGTHLPGLRDLTVTAVGGKPIQ